MPYRETGYDKISLANGTRAEIETAKDKLNTYEPVIATDNNMMLFKDANGELQEVGKPRGSVDTIADLKASRGYILGDVVQVLGFYNKGDGAHHLRIAKDVDDGSGELGVDGLIWCILHNGEVNVSWFGAKGDGITDDKPLIDKIIDNYDNVIIDRDLYFKTFTIPRFTGIEIRLKQNKTIKFLDNIFCKLVTSNRDTSCVIGIEASSNIRIINPNIIGDREENQLTTGESGHGIFVSHNCKDIVIENPNIKDCFGDGIFIGDFLQSQTLESQPSVDIIGITKIENVRRNGISVVGGKANFDTVYIKKVDGTLPKSAMDLEPNFANVKIDVNVNNFYCEDCWSAVDVFSTNTAIGKNLNTTLTINNLRATNIKERVFSFNDNAGVVKINNAIIEKTNCDSLFRHGKMIFWKSLINDLIIKDSTFIDLISIDCLNLGNSTHYLTDIDNFNSSNSSFTNFINVLNSTGTSYLKGKINIDSLKSDSKFLLNNIRMDLDVIENSGYFCFLSDRDKTISGKIIIPLKQTKSDYYFSNGGYIKFGDYISTNSNMTKPADKAINNGVVRIRCVYNETIDIVKYPLNPDFSLFNQLDTPYYTLKMEEEGIYEDFVDYMDSLNSNPLTRPTEPQPSERLLEFAKRYNIA
ncbi:MAG: hypothetical protein ACRC92_10785 [Peptostreptococcaceae bacterium]